MKKELLLNLGVLTIALVYGGLMHGHTPGLNVLLFSGLIIAWLFRLHPEAFRSRIAWLMAGLTVFSAILVILVHSKIATLVHFITLFATAGFFQRRELRFLGFALLMVFSTLVEGPRNVLQQLKQSGSLRPYLGRLGRYLPMVIIPGGIVFVFLLVYMFASPSLLEWVIQTMELMVNWIFDFQLIDWIFRVLIGVALGILLLYPMVNASVAKWIEASREQLVRVRRKGFRGNMLGLLHEHRVALGLLATLNGLTFLYQMGAFRDLLIDRDTYYAASHLSHQVHYATYALILSVVLAICVLLYYFRRNQHFFPKNHILKALALVWLGQNLLLLGVVAVYNFQYIGAYGLAYKRIGVLFFLVAVITGLGFTGIKILRGKTLYFLLQRNSWFVYGLLLLASSINWETVITRYNLFVAKDHPLDINFLIEDLSSQNLYLLEEHWEVVEERTGQSLDEDEWLALKRDLFEAKMDESNWLSWNWPDLRNAKRELAYD